MFWGIFEIETYTVFIIAELSIHLDKQITQSAKTMFTEVMFSVEKIKKSSAFVKREVS